MGECVSKKGSDAVGLGVGLGVGIGVPVALLLLGGLAYYMCRPEVVPMPVSVMQPTPLPTMYAPVQPVAALPYSTVTPIATGPPGPTIISRPVSARII